MNIIDLKTLRKSDLPYFQGNDIKNTHWFRQAALTKLETGYYTKAKPGSREYEEYWKSEIIKCWKGVTIGEVSITGYMYHYLNYSVISLKELNEFTGLIETKLADPPKFWKLHYDWFWSVEIAEKGITPEKLKSLKLHVKPVSLDGKHHIVCLKPRRAGFSYIAASMIARDYSCYYDDLGISPKTVFALAYDENFLLGDGLLDKTWDILDYHNAHTEGGLRHLRQRYDQTLHKQASYKDNEDGVYYRTGGEVIGKVIKENRQTRGTSGYKIYLEELGSFKNIDRYFRSIQQTVEEGGQFTGQIIGFGTGGDKNDFVESLKEFWYNPERFNMMVFDNSQFELSAERTGFFFPATYVHREAIDKDGNPDLNLAEKKINKERQKYIEDIAISSDPSKAREDFMRIKAEQCMIPSEAFMTINVSIFNQDKLAEQSIRIDEKRKEPERGNLKWIESTPGVYTGVTFKLDSNGKIFILERPSQMSEDTNTDFLYIAGIDGIDMGSDNSLVGKNGSKLAMLVKKRTMAISDEYANTYVAMYVDRPSDERDAYENCLKLSMWYNAQINLEYTRKEIISYFRQPPGNLPKQDFRFAKEPRKFAEASVMTFKARDPNKQRIGTVADQKTNSFMDALIKDYVQDYADKLWFKLLVQDLLNYNPEARGRYDPTVAMGLTELFDRELDYLGLVPKSKVRTTVKETMRYVKNPRGGYSLQVVKEEPDEFKNKTIDRYNAITLNTTFNR